jgi:chromate transporter
VTETTFERSTVPPSVSLASIFGLFFQIGIMSFGGGLSAWLYRELVERRKWLTSTEFVSGMALVQALPGVNMTNLSVYVGQKLRGPKGSVVALVGLLTGPFFILIGLATVFRQIQSISWSHSLLEGVATTAVGLLFSMSAKAIRNTKMTIPHLAVLVAIVAAVGGFRWPMIPVVLVLAPVSVAIAWFGTKEDRANAR